MDSREGDANTTAPQRHTSGSNVTPLVLQNTRRSAAHRRSTSQRILENIRKGTSEMLTPDKKLGKAPSVMHGMKAIVTSSWLNLLLVCIPVSWVLHFVLPKSNSNKDTIVFVFSFLAIIPLAKLLGFATEELSLRVGQTLAGLINATLGNAVELIVSIIALLKCELKIVQSSLVGSILSNLLLVLGMCFFAGGMRYSEQGFGVSAVQVNASLLAISVIAILLPAAFHFSANLTTDDEARDLLAVSHGVAVILLFIYVAYLFFQLYSHTALYADEGEDNIKSKKYTTDKFQKFGMKRITDPESDDQPVYSKNIAQSPRSFSTGEGPPSAMFEPSTTAGDPIQQPDFHAHFSQARDDNDDDGEFEEIPKLNLWMDIILLIVITVLVAVTAEFLVGSINGMTAKNVISKEFVGIILLPIVGNAAEHVTAVSVSVKDKLNLSLGVAAGSSIQIALFVIPFIVILAWILGKPLTLLFDPYESVAMFLAVLTVNYVVQDGKSNWLEGFILMCLYLILAVTFWYYPGSDPSDALRKCT